MKKPTMIIILIIAVAVAIAATVAFSLFFGSEPLKKVVSLKGYDISVPEDWVAAADGTLTDKDGNTVGAYTLINEKPDLGNITSYAGAAPDGEVVKQDFSSHTVMCSFVSEHGNTVQYVIKDLPNPEPYAASITLYLSHVSQKTADRIAKSFTLPVLGDNPPKKNMPLPPFNEIGTDMAAACTEKDGSVQVKNIHLIDTFIRLQNEGKATGLHVLSYEKTETDAAALTSWCYIENSGERGYMYTYYPCDNGVYTYDNNPLIFESVTKEMIEDKGITAFRLKIGEAETTRLLEIPINVYRDNAEELLALQKSQADNEAIMKILEKILPGDKRSGLTVSKTGDHITLTFATTDAVTKSSFIKDAAVMFTLLPDVASITVENTNGTSYELKRSDVLAKVETDNATASAENFEKFAEELEKLTPESSGSEDDVAPGTVLYTGTVVVSYDTIVTHPKTGNPVKVGPAAEKRGFGGYLGKPITVTVKKRDTDYIAAATCGGKTIASQTYTSLAGAQGAINLIRAYAG